MAVRNTIALVAAAGFLLFAGSALAQTEQTTLKDGWYTVETAPAVAPKPACPVKKPNKKDDFRPMYRAQGGSYVECAWDNMGRKKGSSGYRWMASECLAASVSNPQFDYGACMRQELFYLRPRDVIFGPQPGYYGYYGSSYYGSGGGYYSAPPCPDTRAPSCYVMPPSATRVYPPSRPYRTPPPTPPPAQSTTPAQNPIYSCNGNGTDGCYDFPGTGN